MMKRNYTRHIRVIHVMGAGQFRCDSVDCTYETNDKRFLEAHAVKHTGEKLYRCDLCDKMFATELYKKLHIKKVHNNKTKLCIKIMNTMEELPKSEPNQNPVAKSKVPTEEVQSENCAINDPTANKSCIIKSEMFGQISTHPTDLLCVQQLANTSKSAEPANGMLRKRLPEDKNDESCCKNDEPTIVKRLQRNTKLHSEIMMQPQNKINPQDFLKNTNVVIASGFLCAAPGCDFLSQNLDCNEGKFHYNLLHRDLTLAEDSFIAINAEMTEAMEIYNEIRKIKEELPQ